jgi:hypothetical protein
MDVILNHYPISPIGTFEIRRTVTVAISAEYARRQVHRWLLLEVSHMMGADEPTLVVGESTCWRVPVHLSTPQDGVIGQVGVIDVDAANGEMIDLLVQKEMLEQRARALMSALPQKAFRPHSIVPTAYLPHPSQRAPQLVLNDDDEPVLTSSLYN